MGYKMFDELHDILEKVRLAVENPPVQNFYLDLKRSGIDNKKARHISKLISENMQGGLLQILPDSVIHMDFSDNPMTSAGFIHICSTWNNALKNARIKSGSIDFKIDFSNTNVGDAGHKYMGMFTDDMVTHDFKFSKFVISGLFEEKAKEPVLLHDTLRDGSEFELSYDSDEKASTTDSDWGFEIPHIDRKVEVSSSDAESESELRDSPDSVSSEKEQKDSQYSSEKAKYIMCYVNIGLTITDTTIDILRTIINPTESKQVKLLTDFVQIAGIAMNFYGYTVGIPVLFASNAVEIAYKLYQKEGKVDDYVELGLSIIQPIATSVVISSLIFKVPLLVSSLLTLYHFNIVFDNGKELYSEWYDNQIMDNSTIEQAASDSDISLSGKMNITHQDEL